MRSCRIRHTNADDLCGLSLFLARQWHETYDRIMGPEKVEQITRSWHNPARLGEELTQAALVSQVVIDDAGQVMAHCLARRHNGVVDLKRLYVSRAEQRQGIGRTLVHRARIDLGSHLDCIVTVDKSNESAKAFYRSQGFADGVEGSEAETDTIQMVAGPLVTAPEDQCTPTHESPP